MSHNNVGSVYNTIIEDVIKSSDIDFAESGVEVEVLAELRLGWQRKLSKLGIAQFPWDPKPEPPVNNAQPVPVAAPKPDYAQHDVHTYTEAQLGPVHTGPPMPHQATNHQIPAMMEQPNSSPVTIKHEPGVTVKPDPVIKQEPGVQHATAIPPPVPSFPTGQPMRGPNVAAQRAMQTLGSQFGQKAAGSINAIHSGMTQQATQLGQPGGMPQGMQTGGQANIPMNPAYRAQLLAQQQRAAHQAALNAVPNGVAKSQVDGGADEDDESFDGVLLQRAANGSTSELGRVQIDSMLHEQIARSAKRMEGGGLMLPLREATKHKAIAKREPKSSGVAQHDGPDDDMIVKDEEDDADAINSDLDDPEDNMDDDEDDDDAMGHIMLCTWDKVQRVKNKWKCTMKDGVLTVNGKEYVFHKATGEYEW